MEPEVGDVIKLTVCQMVSLLRAGMGVLLVGSVAIQSLPTAPLLSSSVGKSIRLVIRRSWVQSPARVRFFFQGFFTTLSMSFIFDDLHM